MLTKKDTDLSPQNSHLFTLRLWHEELGSGQTDLRGKVQHVNSGEVRYFRDWSTLVTFLQEQVRMIDSLTNH